MDVQQRLIVPSNNQQLEEDDYLDRLKPGYRFCPTDAELIVYYLKRKIETGGHPQCRLFEVNIYDHDPQELADGYRACDGKWYFLTPRERKYSNAKQPKRKIKTGGSWRTSQSDAPVYDAEAQLVGRKRNFNHVDVDGNKSDWLMHEYITNDPDLPVGTDGNKLSEWVLCKIYKKDAKYRRDNTNQAENTSTNQPNDEPSTKRRRLQESHQPKEHVQTLEENHLLGTKTQMVASMENSIQESSETNGLTPHMVYDQDQSTSGGLTPHMAYAQDNLSLDTTSGLAAAAMGYDQSNFQDQVNEYIRLQQENYHPDVDHIVLPSNQVDDNLWFDADELLTTIQRETV